MAAERIMAGGAEIMIAGGVESMSQVPMGGVSFQPNPELADKRPEVYISMGLTAENVADKYGVSREDQDEFALKSHQKAVKAWEEGYFADQITPIDVVHKYVTSNGEMAEETVFHISTG